MLVKLFLVVVVEGEELVADEYFIVFGLLRVVGDAGE